MPAGDELSALVERLDFRAAFGFYTDLDAAARQAGDQRVFASERQKTLVGLLVDRLNRNRRQHARRLFYQAFEAVFSSETWLASSAFAVPGLVLRAHAAGLFLLASRVIARDAVRSADQLFERLARQAPVCALLETAEANRLRDDLCRRMAGFLTTAMKDRATTGEALAAFRKAVAEEEPELKRTHIDADLLRLLRDILLLGASEQSAISGLIDALPVAGGEGEIERATMKLIALQDKLPSDIAAMLPAIALNRRGCYAVGSAWLRRRPNHAGAGMAAEAMMAHYSAATATLVEGMNALVRETFGGHVAAAELPGLLHRGGCVLPDDQELMARIDAALDRYAGLLDALTAAGLTEARRTEALFRDPWADLLGVMTQIAAPLARTRLLACAEAVRQPPDLAAALWLGRAVWRWRRILIGYGYSVDGMTSWQLELGAELGRILDKAGRSHRDGDPAGDDLTRFAHLVRIQGIAQETGATLFDHVTPSHRGIMSAIRARLRQGGSVGETEAALIGGFGALVRRDMEKIRHWKSEDQVGLIDAISSAGIRLD